MCCPMTSRYLLIIRLCRRPNIFRSTSCKFWADSERAASGGRCSPSKSQYANPILLVQKSGTGFRMVVDYRKVNAKIRFDSYSMPSIEQAFDQFAGAVIFSVFGINSAYIQIPLTPRSIRVTAFFYTLCVVRVIRTPWKLLWVVRAQLELWACYSLIWSEIMSLTNLMNWWCTLVW